MTKANLLAIDDDPVFHERQRACDEKNPFEGTSAAIRHLEKEANKVVHTEAPILIQGETGSGKAVLAKWLHNNGPRAKKAFVDINCANCSKNLLESDLFGYGKGAFTGADTWKPGLVEVAHHGILFLDELAEMDLTIQPKLLKIVEDKRFRRLGEVRERVVDIQIIAATNRDLKRLIARKEFRDDLYYRINTFSLHIPPLRERVEDIPILANSLLKSLAKEFSREERELSPSAEAALKEHRWPGNIRELRNVLTRAITTSEGRIIDAEDLNLPQGTVVAMAALAVPLSKQVISWAELERQRSEDPAMTLAEVEQKHIKLILEVEQGNVVKAAVRLGIPRSTLYQKIKAYGIRILRKPPNLWPDET